MAPGRKVKIEKHGIIFEPNLMDLLENDNLRRVGQPKRKRYYESNKILGILYRSIDERSFFRNLHERSAVIKDDSQPSAGVLADVCEYVNGEMKGLEWEQYIDEAIAMREMYVCSPNAIKCNSTDYHKLGTRLKFTTSSSNTPPTQRSFSKKSNFSSARLFVAQDTAPNVKRNTRLA